MVVQSHILMFQNYIADEILSMHNVKLHILTDGNKFDLIKKLPFEEEKFSHEDNTKENI